MSIVFRLIVLFLFNVYLCVKLNRIDQMTSQLVQASPSWFKAQLPVEKETDHWSLLLRQQEEYYQHQLDGLQSVLTSTHHALRNVRSLSILFSLSSLSFRWQKRWIAYLNWAIDQCEPVFFVVLLLLLHWIIDQIPSCRWVESLSVTIVRREFLRASLIARCIVKVFPIFRIGVECRSIAWRFSLAKKRNVSVSTGMNEVNVHSVINVNILIDRQKT